MEKVDRDGARHGVAWIAYFLGLVTGLIVLLLAYLFALLLPKFRDVYNSTVCNFPPKNET
jgi:hypothetical protein